MSRSLWSFLAAALVLATAPPTPAAGKDHHSSGYAYGYDDDKDRDDDFSWTIVNDDNTSMSDMSGLESLEQLRDRFGNHFLYFRDGDDHFVVLDEKLVDRAERAAHDIKLYGKEMGLLARAQIQGTVGSTKTAQKMAIVARRQAELGKEIARRSMNGESTARLQREMDQLSEDMDLIRANMHSRDVSPAEARDLDRKTEETSKRLSKAVREAQQEMRDILKEAKERHLVKRVN
jgi:hypothetical protein